MYEYGIYNEKTGEQSVMFGRTIEDARRRSGKSVEDWTVYYSEYVD